MKMTMPYHALCFPSSYPTISLLWFYRRINLQKWVWGIIQRHAQLQSISFRLRWCAVCADPPSSCAHSLPFILMTAWSYFQCRVRWRDRLIRCPALAICGTATLGYGWHCTCDSWRATVPLCPRLLHGASGLPNSEPEAHHCGAWRDPWWRAMTAESWRSRRGLGRIRAPARSPQLP